MESEKLEQLSPEKAVESDEEKRLPYSYEEESDEEEYKERLLYMIYSTRYSDEEESDEEESFRDKIFSIILDYLNKDVAELLMKYLCNSITKCDGHGCGKTFKWGIDYHSHESNPFLRDSMFCEDCDVIDYEVNVHDYCRYCKSKCDTEDGTPCLSEKIHHWNNLTLAMDKDLWCGNCGQHAQDHSTISQVETCVKVENRD